MEKLYDFKNSGECERPLRHGAVFKEWIAFSKNKMKKRPVINLQGYTHIIFRFFSCFKTKCLWELVSSSRTYRSEFLIAIPDFLSIFQISASNITLIPKNCYSWFFPWISTFFPRCLIILDVAELSYSFVFSRISTILPWMQPKEIPVIPDFFPEYPECWFPGKTLIPLFYG